MILYVNTVTGTIDEVDGDSYLIDTDIFFTDTSELTAEELVELAGPEAEEISR